MNLWMDTKDGSHWPERAEELVFVCDRVWWNLHEKQVFTVCSVILTKCGRCRLYIMITEALTCVTDLLKTFCEAGGCRNIRVDGRLFSVTEQPGSQVVRRCCYSYGFRFYLLFPVLFWSFKTSSWGLRSSGPTTGSVKDWPPVISPGMPWDPPEGPRRCFSCAPQF